MSPVGSWGISLIFMANPRYSGVVGSPAGSWPIGTQVAREGQKGGPKSLACPGQLRFDRLFGQTPAGGQVANTFARDVLGFQGLPVMRRQLRHGDVDEFARLFAPQQFVAKGFGVQAVVKGDEF